MRLTADAATHERCRLLFAVYPVFVSAVKSINSEYRNYVTIMRTEIMKMIPMVFREEHFEYDLSTDAFQDCKYQLENILCHFEGLVDEAVCYEDGTSQEHDTELDKLVPRLMALRSQILSDGDHPNNAPSEDHIQKVAKVVSFGKAPAQFGSLSLTAHNFNQTMQKIFAERGRTGNDQTYDIFQGDSVFDAKPVYDAEKLAKASKELYQLLKDNTCSYTKKAHCAHIHLTGFDKPEFDMVIPLCERPTLWQRVYFSQCHETTNSEPQSLNEICTELTTMAMAVRNKKASCVLFRESRIYSSSGAGKLPRRSKPLKPPALTIRQILDKKFLTQAGSSSPGAISWLCKIRLGTLIANSLLFLHGSPFIQAPWNAGTISILQDQSLSSDEQAPLPDPYVTCSFDPRLPEQSLREKQPDEGDPFLLDLITLLLELEIGQEVILEKEDIDEITKEPSMFMALVRIHSRLNGVDCIYNNVIDACLDMYSEFIDLGKQDEYHRFRMQFFKRVVKPLKDRYYVLSNPKAFAPRTMPPQQKLPTSCMVPFKQSARSMNLIKEPIVEVSELGWPPQDQGGIESSPTVDDDPSLLDSKGRISSSWLWLRRIDAVNKRYLEDVVLQNPTAQKVKIAILDTGCDLYADCVRIMPDAESRLAGHWYDGVPGGSPSPVDDDTSPVKHGTALVSLLLRVAPYAEVFVSRVARSATELDSAKESVANAIIYAADTWDVDILSMSFGFPWKEEEVKKAIRKATRIKEDRDKDIVFFAAARNDGSNAREMYPASHNAVISVRGTDHTGAFVSDYNPDVWPNKKGELYGTLGKDVPYDRGDSKAKLSGCSPATPILVGITAMIIHYISCLSPDNIDLNALRSREGILQVLQEVSIEKDGGRRYVAPWEFFEKEEGVRIATIAAALGKLQR